MSVRALKLARELPLPLDAVTQKIAWLGRTGSGKTFGCKRMVEQMLEAHVQVVILDGSGAWAGLRLGPKAFKIPVLGGLYSDIPLESTAGALVADVIVDTGTSMVLDVSQMLDSERTRFATAFGERFFHRKKAAPGAVHLVLEECQDFVPQNPQSGEERMLHEFQRLAKQGRAHGIGMSFLSQRPQEISKKALNQVECVFAFQMTGPHERKALEYWLSDKGCEEKLSDILPRLEVGSPHVWSPQWLKVSRVVHILPIESLDTSRTPKVGDKKLKRKALKKIDLGALEKAMAETIERAKSDDPKVLRARIAELEKELKKKTPVAQKGVALREFEVVVDRRHLEQTIEASESFEKELGVFLKALEDVRRGANSTVAAARRARQTGPRALAKRIEKSLPPGWQQFVRASEEAAKKNGDLAVRVVSDKTSNGAGSLLPKAERQILTALAQHGPLSLTQAAIIAGYSSKSGGMRNAAGALRSLGYVTGGNDRLEATPEGLAVLGTWNPLPTGAALAAHWYRQLPKAEREILAVVVANYPRSVALKDAAEECGYAPDSGGVRNAAGKLRTLDLVVGSNAAMVANERLVG